MDVLRGITVLVFQSSFEGVFCSCSLSSTKLKKVFSFSHENIVSFRLTHDLKFQFHILVFLEIRQLGRHWNRSVVRIANVRNSKIDYWNAFLSKKVCLSKEVEKKFIIQKR